MPTRKDALRLYTEQVFQDEARRNEFVKATKFRTLNDMSKSEIKALEKLYGCRVATKKPKR